MKLGTVLSLFSTLRVEVHPEQTARLREIENEDYSGVVRKTLEHFSEIGFVPPDGYIERAVYALKQYYAVALLDPANAHAISRPLDPFWHAHVLHTEQYFDFCDRVVGEYMHHRPLDHGNHEHVAAVRSLYDYTTEVMGKLFSHVDADFWPAGVPDAALICVHKGNQDLYEKVQPFRLFEPDARGIGY